MNVDVSGKGNSRSRKRNHVGLPGVIEHAIDFSRKATLDIYSSVSIAS